MAFAIRVRRIQLALRICSPGQSWAVARTILKQTFLERLPALVTEAPFSFSVGLTKRGSYCPTPRMWLVGWSAKRGIRNVDFGREITDQTISPRRAMTGQCEPQDSGLKPELQSILRVSG